MDYTLYNYWRSSSSWRVRIVLSYKNIPYNYRSVNLAEGESQLEEHIQRNPLKQVPVLVTPEVKLSQSMAILRFLEAKHPQPSLVPTQSDLAAKMWEICEIVNSGIQPLQNMSVTERIEQLGGDKNQWISENIKKGFRAIEKIVKHSSEEFCIGNHMTLADACLLPQYYAAVKHYNLDMSEFPHIQRVCEKLVLLPQIQSSFPENQPDYPEY